MAQYESATAEKGQAMLCTSSLRLTSTRADMKDQDEGGVASPSDHSTEEFTWTEEEETAVRRKLDRVIVPLTTFLYLLCFLDRYVWDMDLPPAFFDAFIVPTSGMHVYKVWEGT